MIPKILFQTSKIDPDDRYIRTVFKYLGEGWTYLHFTDETIIKFFDSNPLSEFPMIRDKFSKVSGANKADIFRLYFLMIRGGVYMESDAILMDQLEQFICDRDFVTIRSVDKSSIFPGILASVPGHTIIYDALKFAYSADPRDWQLDYHLSCKNLADIIDNNDWIKNPNVSIYKENGVPNDPTRFVSIDNRGRKILSHFPDTKIIPEEFLIAN